jgi:periplasmic protein TonB
MADGNLRSVDWHADLMVPATAPPAPFPAAMPLRVVLSEATDLWGVQPSGWLAAALLFAAIAAGGVLLPWRVALPPAWPEDAVRFRVVFEEPAPLPAAPEAAVLSAPVASPPSQAPLEPSAILPQPETAMTEVEPEPSPIATAPPVERLPKPPSRKPALRHATAVPPAPPSDAAAIGSTAPPPMQTAALATTAAPVPHGVSAGPSLAYAPKPDYPMAARTRGLQGRVVLRIDISATGIPATVSVVTSSGHAILDRAAIATVQSWRFRPAMQDGIAVTGQVDQPVDFRLED